MLIISSDKKKCKGMTFFKISLSTGYFEKSGLPPRDIHALAASFGSMQTALRVCIKGNQFCKSKKYRAWQKG
jgi:hypothetical protein